MARLTINPVTRIEGHARVEIDIDDNNQVTSSVFQVMDFRGWETFTRGTPIEMMPLIMPRVCGTCSVSHHLAAVKTIDNVFGVTPPPAAKMLRQAMNLAGYLHSHGVHIFALAGPDLLLGLDADPAKRNIIGLVEKNPDLAKKALRLRRISTHITEVLGGRGIHPVVAVAGGMATSLSKGDRDKLKKEAEESVSLAKDLLEAFKQQFQTHDELLRSLELPTHYLGLIKEDGGLDVYDGELRLRAPDKSCFDFPAEKWDDYLVEEVDPHSYAKKVFFRQSKSDSNQTVYRVGPLARLNCCDHIDTPMANQELTEFRRWGGIPCHQTVLYHQARIIEVLYATEKLVELFSSDEICSTEVRTPVAGHFQDGQQGTGIVEAPRGTLMHRYTVDKQGVVKDINLIVATQQNIQSINDTISMSAQKYLHHTDDNQWLNRVEFGIRCYDPCLSCATHRIGEMKLEAVVRRNGQVIRAAKR